MKVTYHRIFRFWPSGDLFVYLTGQVQPESARRHVSHHVILER